MTPGKLATIIALPATLALAAVLIVTRCGAACTTEQRLVLHEGGFDFYVSETDCDLLAKDSAISVFASRAGERERTLLFKYDSTRHDDPLPGIAVSNDGRIRISLPVVSSIYEQHRQWTHGAVEYEIGHVEYP